MPGDPEHTYVAFPFKGHGLQGLRVWHRCWACGEFFLLADLWNHITDAHGRDPYYNPLPDGVDPALLPVAKIAPRHWRYAARREEAA